MERTERWFLVASSIAWLLASSVAPGGAAHAASDPALEQPATLSGSPAAFAERVTASHGGYTSGRAIGSLGNAIELIVLAAVCAIGVAFYSSTSARGDGTRVPAPIRRR
jgi:hypothetical protein